jgi:UDP-2-acetamido-3-amino-2,3-dideoxy-glucuronate N-acetyltransferase
VKLGIIGAGYWGANLIRVCRELGVLESVCDADEAAIAKVAQQYPGIDLEFDVPSLLERPIEAVVIAAPVAVHAELALQALAAGKHVFVEKPLATTANAAASVVCAAHEAQRTLFVGHVLLYHPAVQRMLDLVRSGAIGTVRHVRSRRLSFGKLREAENVWWSFAPHDVAIVLEIFGSIPNAVSGNMHAFVRPQIADFAYAALSFEGGRSAHIEVSWLDPDKSARLDVFGSAGVLRLLDAREGARLILVQCGDREHRYGMRELWRGSESEIPVSSAEPLRLELCAFVDAVRTGKPPLTDGAEGLRVVQVLAMLDECVPALVRVEAGIL